MTWPIISLPLSRELIVLNLIKPTLNLTWTGSQHNSNVTVSCMIFQRFSYFLSSSFAKEKNSLAPYFLVFIKEDAKLHLSLLLKSQTKLVPIWSSYLDIFPAGIQTLLPLQGLNKIMWNIAFLKGKQWLHSIQGQPVKTFYLHFVLGIVI